MASGDPKQDGVYLDTRERDMLYPGEIELLSLAELEGLASEEAWTAVGTNMQMSYCTHGAFRYFGKFPPPIATHLIREYASEDDDVVYDLMSGSGTTGVECLLHSRRSLLNDINPLCRLLAKVKTLWLPTTKMREAVNCIEKFYRPLTREEYPYELQGLQNPEHYFLNETDMSLRGLKYLIEQNDDEDIRDFLMVALLACIRRVSRATSQQGRLFLDVNTAEQNALPFFLKRAEILINGISNIPDSKEHVPEIRGFDLKSEIGDAYKNKASLVILHPPYFNSYKYSSVNSLELAWMGVNRRNFNKQEVREFFKVGKEENAEKYVEDMARVVMNSSQAMKDNGHMAIMIGDTRIHGNYIPVTRMLIDTVAPYFEIEKVVLRVPKYTEASWAASQRRESKQVGIELCDFIIVLRKKNAR